VRTLTPVRQHRANRGPLMLPLRSRPQCRSKCNEALSRDLWPLDPFESAPMRATSSGLGNSILCAIYDLLKIKTLERFLSGKSGKEFPALKKLPCGFFPAAATRQYYCSAMAGGGYSTNRDNTITSKDLCGAVCPKRMETCGTRLQSTICIRRT
jgi:hypothetical protein